MSEILEQYLTRYSDIDKSKEFVTFQVCEKSVTDLPTFWGRDRDSIYSRVVRQLHERAARWCEKQGYNTEYAYDSNVWHGGSESCQCSGCADCYNSLDNLPLENGDLAVIFICQPLELERIRN